MQKAEIRRAHRAARSRTGGPRGDGGALAAQVMGLLDALDVSGTPTIAGYLPLPGEPDILVCLAQALERGHRVVVPRTLAGHLMEWVPWRPEVPLRPDRHGLHAPVGAALPDALALRPVVLLVPALAVDWAGARVGHGAGYYDRALAGAARWPDGPLRVAIVHPEELVTAPLPMEPHDEPMDAVATAAGWLLLGDV